jgi:hypothetical protein
MFHVRINLIGNVNLNLNIKCGSALKQRIFFFMDKKSFCEINITKI